MPNKHYKKGYRKENKIVNNEKYLGRIAFRSAGSHSPIDVVSIDRDLKKIFLIQAKTYEPSPKQKKEIFESVKGLEGNFEIEFILM